MIPIIIGSGVCVPMYVPAPLRPFTFFFRRASVVDVPDVVDVAATSTRGVVAKAALESPLRTMPGRKEGCSLFVVCIVVR
jgi:hypothetical protein